MSFLGLFLIAFVSFLDDIKYLDVGKWFEVRRKAVEKLGSDFITEAELEDIEVSRICKSDVN